MEILKKAWARFKVNVSQVTDRKKLAWMAVFFFCVGFWFSVMWYYRGEVYWWFPLAFFSAGYLFVLLMSYLLRNNP